MKFTVKIMSLIMAMCIAFSALFALGIGSGVTLVTAADDSTNYLSELWMKVDYLYHMNKGTRAKISSSSGVYPYYVSGNDSVYVPLSSLAAYCGNTYTVSGKSISMTRNSKVYKLTVDSRAWTVGGVNQLAFDAPVVRRNGEVFVTDSAAENIFGLHSFINPDIGLIVFSTSKITYEKNYSSLAVQIANIDGLLYDFPLESEIYGLLLSEQGSANVHPRLVCDQDRFNELKAIWSKDESTLTEDEKTVREWMASYITKANTQFAYSFVETSSGADWRSSTSKDYYRQPYFLYDENGNRLEGYWVQGATRKEDKFVAYSEYTYPGDSEPTKVTDVYDGTGLWGISSPYGDGYDEGNRSKLEILTVYLKYFAFAWQLTGDEKWADAFYLLALEFGKWQHWGEGHTLNLADGAVEYAIGYDWIYPAFSGTAEGRAKLREMAEILFIFAVEVGDKITSMKASSSAPKWEYTSAINSQTRQLRQTGTGRTAWDIRSRDNNWQQVCTSGLVMSALAVVDEFSDNQAATDTCTRLIARLLPCINNANLHYAPDGSYIEAPGYWSYATNTYMRMILSLKECLGSDFGFLDTVGLHTSFYFATNVTDTNFRYWNYHDGGSTPPDGQYFYTAARLFNDPNLAYYRDLMLKGDYGIRADIMDVITYDKALSAGGGVGVLDYYGKNIETVTMRSSWENKNGIFTGIHAGANNVSHGDVDSGNFYLSAYGVKWFYDPGSENYNIESNAYFDITKRYFYYRKSAVAHSTVLILDETQEDLKNYGQIFNSQTETYATVKELVSKDEGAYAYIDMKPQYGANCTSATRANMLTNSRTTVVLQDEIKFSKATDLVWQGVCNNFVELSADKRTAIFRTFKTSAGGVTLRATLLSDNTDLRFEYVKDELFLGGVRVKSDTLPRGSEPNERIVIKANGVTDFNVAVVFEFIDNKNQEVRYDYAPVSEWTIKSLDDWDSGASDDGNEGFKYKYSDLVKALDDYKLETTDEGRVKALREAYKITQSIDKSVSSVKKAISEFDGYVKKYNAEIIKINDREKERFFSSLSLICGIGKDE